MRDVAVALLLGAVLVGLAGADEELEDHPPKPLTPEQAADEVLEAFQGGNQDALKALARKNKPDPWLVADELCYRGEHDAAEAFAEAAPRVDVEQLPAYVAAWRKREPDKAERDLLAAMNAATQARTPQEVVEGTASLGESLETVVRVRLAAERGYALQMSRRLGESQAVLRRAADAACALGWLAWGSGMYHEAGKAAFQGGAFAAAGAVWERRLTLCARRGDRRGAAATLGNIGIVYCLLGDYVKALPTYEQALAAKEALGDRTGAAGTLGNIGGVHLSLGDYAKALSTYARALAALEVLGDKQGASDMLANIGSVHLSQGDYAKALSTYEQALAAKEALGDERGAAKTLGNIGLVHESLGDYPKAHSILERALAAKVALGDRAGAARTLGNIGSVYSSQGDYTEALSIYEQAFEAQEALGDKVGASKTLGNIGGVHFSLGDYAKALSTYEQALAAHEARGDKAGAAKTLGNIGLVHQALGDYAKAHSTLEQALAVKEALGDKRGVATTLGDIGTVYFSQGDYAQALSTYERALAAREALGDKRGVARTLGNTGIVYESLGDYAQALSTHEQAFVAQKALGDKVGASKTLGNIGNVYESLGDYGKARSTYEQALAAHEARGDKAGAAATLGNIGAVYVSLGDYAKALSTLEQALAAKESLGNKAGAAGTRGNIGAVYHSLGDSTRALSVMERALTAQEALGDKRGAAGTLGNMGTVYESLGDHAGALSTLEQALAAQEALGDKAGAATTLGNIGNVYSSRGEFAKALSTYEQALAAHEALRDKEGTARTLANIGIVYHSQKDHVRALSVFEQALAAHEALGDKATMAAVLGYIGGVHYSLRNHAKALSFARRAVVQLRTVVSGLGAEAGAGAREPLAFIYDIGAGAALAQGNASELTYFLESGRAGALLEGLSAREALWAAAVSPELRSAEAKARAIETAAMKALQRATYEGDLKKVRARRQDLNAAQEGVSEVIARIQREAIAGASLIYPEPATLAEIRATLSDGDVLVLYGMLEEEACALVITKAAARIVSLGESAQIHLAVEALALDDRRSDSKDALAALSKRVVEPLGLPETTKRLFVSPAGVLGYVPFGALIPQVAVAYVPSGTTHRLFLGEQALRGAGVLALGDPDYETERNRRAVAVVRGGLRLGPLPATREEAKAVGTEVLLGSEATKEGLKASIGRQRRWRAVHFACHGLVNTERPALSSLAVTPSEDDDGFLTCLDVFRAQIPADLVVLSACETAKGRVVKTEGIVGMVRAFMFAGASRVICSLWKVDDKATRALMIKFYELWNPKDGSNGLGAAAALKAAQEFIRDHPDHPEWRHPHYWAAWVLWGLPD